jgi:hypothetical protein
MKLFAIRILSVVLILSIGFFHTAFVLAEEVVIETEPETTVAETTTEETTVAETPAPEETIAEETSSEELTLASTTPLVLAPEPIDFTATSTNAATTTNDVAVDAATGDNTASTTGTAIIDTGTALSNANVMNVVNVNIFNSEAFFAFINRMAAGDENVDMRELLMGFDGSLGCEGCSVESSMLGSNNSTHINNTNNATIDNTVIVRSSTGNNTATSTDGSTINTGNAYANANVVNVANTNFTDSRYVMMVFNNFGNFGGDIVLPSASFFEMFLGLSNGNHSLLNNLTVNNANTGNVTSTVATTADTGNNNATASSTEGSSIETGNAVTGSTVINNVNENYIGGNAIALVFRIYGNWSGKAFNIPSSLNFNGTPVSIQFLADSAVTGGGTGGSASITSNNSASINNNVSVSASTGNNNASGGASSISTGNAYANANIVNVANTNIIGRNWITAIINIFGDWSGNLSFGQPDLWVGTRASFVNNYAGPDAQVIYKYTIKNNGDAPAHGVTLTHSIGMPYVALGTDFENPFVVGDLAPGEVKEIIRPAKATSQIPFGETSVSNTIQVTAEETDGNPIDNTDSLTIILSYLTGLTNINNNPVTTGVPANFTISKTHSGADIVSASSTVDYTIVIKNLGGEADHALFIDELRNEKGDILHQEEWDLGKVASQEEIKITYSTFFNASTTEGMYTNTAYIRSATGSFPHSPVATSTVTIGTLLTARLTRVERPLPQPLSIPKVEASTESFVPEVSTTTSSTTPSLVLSTDSLDAFASGQVAGAFNAFAAQNWYWYALFFTGVGYLVLQYRRVS